MMTPFYAVFCANPLLDKGIYKIIDSTICQERENCGGKNDCGLELNQVIIGGRKDCSFAIFIIKSGGCWMVSRPVSGKSQELDGLKC